MKSLMKKVRTLLFLITLSISRCTQISYITSDFFHELLHTHKEDFQKLWRRPLFVYKGKDFVHTIFGRYLVLRICICNLTCVLEACFRVRIKQVDKYKISVEEYK
jgi:hypothetical protein